MMGSSPSFSLKTLALGLWGRFSFLLRGSNGEAQPHWHVSKARRSFRRSANGLCVVGMVVTLFANGGHDEVSLFVCEAVQWHAI